MADRPPKRPFSPSSARKNDEKPSRDNVPTKRSFVDKVNLFENAAGPDDSAEYGAFSGGGLREGSDDETFEQVLEERDVYDEDGRKKGKMVVVNMVTVHKSVKPVTSPESSPVTKHLSSFDRECCSISRSSSRDSLSSPKSWRKSFVGTMSQFDLHIEEIKNEQERVQKKTFVNWINSYLCQRIPPLKIDDLIEDLKDGTKLLALLEVLSGDRLPIERGRNMRRPHFLSNVNTAIQFLQSKRIKLVNINSADIVDGRPPIVLGLVWTIILYFQIEENTKGLSSLNYSFSGSTSSFESIRSPTMEMNRKADGAKKTLLKWVGTVIPKESNIKVKDFGPSWRDGIAFLTIIDTIQTNLVDITTLRNETNRARLETAFSVAEQDLGITRLLDPEDVDVDRPDERSVMTYVAQFVHKYPEVRSDGGESIDTIQKDYNLLLTWLIEKTQYLSWPQNLSQDFSEFSKAQEEFVDMSHVYNRLKMMCNSASSICISAQSWKELERLWTLLENLMKNWQWQLDEFLPEPFKVIGEWITKAEQLITDNNIPSVMNEETAVIISRKLEEHKSFFADLPEVRQKFNELLAKTKNQNKEVNDLSRRLNAIDADAYKRRTYLKFLEHKCCLIAFLNLTENKLKAWTVKYGRQQDVLQLLEKYNNFVIGNNIFQEFNKAFIDMKNVVQEYKHECNVEYKESVAIEKFMKQTAEHWKSIAMELRCAQSMLEEVISYWRRWNSLSEDMKMWLADAVKKINLSHEQRIDFFQDIGVWKEKYELLNDTVSFLIATCEDSISAELKQEFLNITATWESVFSKAKDYMHSGDMIRNRKEFLEGLDILHKWNVRAEHVMSSIHLSSSRKIKDYLNDIQSLQSQLDQMDDLFKAISKKFQVLIKDLTRDEVNEMMLCVKREKESLVNIRASIPVQLNALHHMLVQYDALETGQKEINDWLNNCEEFLSTLKLSKSQGELHGDIEYLKSIMVRMSYYQSMLSSKNKIFQSIIKSIQPEKDQGSNAEFVQTMADLNAKFSRITQECHQWDVKLQQTLRCWHNFIEVEKVILDWIETSEQIFSEEQTNSRQTLESQKGYFEYSNNNKWITELDNVESELIRCFVPSEQETIRNRSKAIKLKYQECLNMVPAYMTRVEYKLNEITFNQCMNEAEKELNIEQQMFSRNENVNLILKRNVEYFDNGVIFKELKSCLNNMNIASKKLSNTPVDLSLDKSINRFESLERRTTEMRQKCKQIPNQLQDYKAKFTDLEKWMNAVDISVERLLKGLLNDEEFEKEKSIFQDICRDVDSKRDDMKWMVQILDSLLPYVSEGQQQVEQKNLEELIVRYKHLIPTIDMTITKTEMYTKCFIYKKEVTEIGKILESTKDEQLSKKGESWDDLSELIINQEQVIERLEKQRMVVMSTLQRGKQLVKHSSSVPNFIPQLVSKLETDWSFVYNESIDKFNKLKNAQKLLIDYTKTKNEVMEIIKRAENELKTVSDDNKHNSREISMQLRSKQELSLALREAAENLLNKLRDISQDLHIPEKEFAIENEINVIENKLVNTIQTVDKETQRLEKLSMKLCELDSGLNKIHVWSVESAPAVIERIQQDQTNPEIKARGIVEVQDELQKRRDSLERLTQDLHSFEKETDTNETQKLRQDLDEVRMSILSLECDTNRKNEEISIDLNEWQIQKTKLEEIRPWLENVEIKINTDYGKPITLQLAKDWLKNAQLIDSECQKRIENLKTITAENKTAVILNEVDAIQSRCIAVQSSAVQQITRLQRLLLNWNELNEKTQKVEEKLNQPSLSELKGLIINQSFSEDLLEKKLLEYKALYQELNECHSEISSLSQSLNGINQHFSVETTNDVKEKLNSLKAKNNEYLKLMHEQMQIISNIISDKKDQEVKVNTFCEWLNELYSKVNKCNIVPTNSVEETLKKLHLFTDEHMEKQSLFGEIEDNLKNFNDNATVQQSIVQFKELQDLIQKKKIVLEKINEFFIWYETLMGKLNHAEFQFDSNQVKTNLLDDVNTCSEEVDLWEQNVDSIENLLQQSKTTIPGLSITDQFHQLKSKLVNIQEKLRAKEENEQKVKHCQKTISRINEALVKNIKEIENTIDNHLSSVKSEKDVINVIPKLQELSDISELNEQLKTLETEGELLIKLDKNNSIFVQNILLETNAELSNLKTTSEKSVESLTAIMENWSRINEIKNKINSTREECKTILESIESPNDLIEAQVVEEKYNKALKQSIAVWDVLPAMGEAVQKLVTLAENYPQLNVKKLNQNYKNDLEGWEKYHAEIKENTEVAHSQQIIWKQVYQTKDSILQWLSDVNIELLDCTSNFDDIEKIKSKLVKYSEERELNLESKNNLVEKIKKLQKLKGNKPILTLDSLCKLIDDQFSVVESVANNLVGLVSDFSQQEETIKSEIKKRTAEINQIRENVIKCDNLNNELDALLVNLKSCQKCKNDLIKMNLNIDAVNHSVSEMTDTFPIISESTTIKELKSLKKRYESVVQQADKVETTLMTYLKKHLEDDLNNISHSIKSANEKLTWCKPEEEIEKDQIEIKLRSVQDITENLKAIKEQKSRIDYVLSYLNQYSSGDFSLDELCNNNESLCLKLEDTEKQTKERKKALEKIISIWIEYQKNLDSIVPLLNVLENDVKTSIEIPIDMNALNVMENNINEFQSKVDEANKFFNELASCAENIKRVHNKSTLDKQVLKLKRRLESYQNSVDKCVDRTQRLKEMKNEFNVSYKKATDLIEELNNKLKSVESAQPFGKKSIQNAQSDLVIIKSLNKQLEECQQLVNDTVSKGECVYPDITMENREEIRSKVKQLRSVCESLNDEYGNITKTIENALVQKSSFDESCNQVQNWLHELEEKLSDCKKTKRKNIMDKRTNCNNLKTLKQDLIAYKNVIDQLREKVTQLNEPDADSKLRDILEKYKHITSEVNKCLKLNESQLKNHELYLENVETFNIYLKSLQDEYSVAACNVSETDLDVFKNIINHKSEGESMLDKCRNVGSAVSKETDENGKPAVQNELEELKINWENLMLNCEKTLKTLNQKQNQDDEVLNKIENLNKYLKTIETQIKDRSLKNALASKQQYLEKLKLFDEDITKKHMEILEIQSDSVEVSPDVNNAIANLMKTYQSVKTRTKESILKYENFVREHQTFDLNYKEFFQLVKCLSEELKQYSAVVGDLGLLHERQKKLLALSDSKCQQSVQYESLVNNAEKLYAQTSPDGREIIRQQMKDLRTAWELVSESLQSSLSKLDNCLMQFAEFSLSQEQLTKWLKNIEQAMQQHTETKATLQEKKAQLQNHIVINQEILSHQALVQSVCDKAQELVNQTKDNTLNTYLDSIKSLYEKIVTKSKELMDSLEHSVKNHSEFNHVCQKLKQMLKEQRDKIRENDNIAAEKDIIIKKIHIFKEMKTENLTENDMRNHLEHVYKLACKSTTKKGISVMSKEISKIDSDKSQLIIQLDGVIERMEEILTQWTDYENGYDDITNWFRLTESLIKDQQLQPTFESKKNKLKLFMEKRNEILQYEPKIEKFIDNSNNLLHISGVERLKPLILQLGNRYQLLLVLSKEMVAKWQSIADDHKNFNDKLAEFKSWLETLESKPMEILKDNDIDLNKKLSLLQSIYGSSDQTSAKISLLTTLGENLYPDTSTAGRETIRQQLKAIREKWDALDEQIKSAQKSLGVQLQQWNNYQETLLQTINWLESVEKVIASNQSPVWSSPQEIRAKLLKQKATMQEIKSHSRMIETIMEKGKTIKKPKDETDLELSLKDRYELLREKMNSSISQLENYLETYQQYQDLHKSYQDTQKQLWDQLSTYTDYSGNKQILESRLNKVYVIQTTFDNNKTTLLTMENFVKNSKGTIPQKAIDTMSRDHTNLQFEQEKFQSLLNDLIEGLRSRIDQWVEFENLMQQLISWHNDTEKKLQNYSEKGTLEEKTQQYNKFQDLEKEIKGKSNSVKDLIAFGDHLQQSLLDDMKKKNLSVDKLIDQSIECEITGEARLSTKVKQISSRYQSMQATIKDILNKCNDSIKIHQEYIDKYNECSIQLSNVQSRFKNVNEPPLSSQAIHQYLIQKNGKLNELLDTKPNVASLLNSCIELGEKLYLSTSTSGREYVKCQIEELQTVFDTLYDDILSINREVKDQLTKWGGFEELYNELNQWFNNTKQILNKDLLLKSTLDEKKMQLQIYRDMLQAALKKKQDIVKLQDLTGRMKMRDNDDVLLSSLSKQHDDILKQIQDFVDKYEAIVKDHEQYTKSVMEMQEWLDATHNTLMLWGDTNLEKISLLSNLDRIKNLLVNLTEEENRIHNIQKLAEKVIPGTVESGQVNIRAQIDSSQQDWEGLVTTVKSSIEALENKLNSWNEFDTLKESCLMWLRETDYKIHAIDLKNSLQEKKIQFEELKDLQGVIRAKELEIDSITEKSQNLYTMSMSNKNTQITEIVQKFHQLSIKIKELVGKWQQFVNNHLEFESSLSEAIIWLDTVDDKLTSCTDFKSNSKADLEEKLIVIQEILLYKDDGFSKVQNCIEIGQIVLANTAPEGHKPINESLISLQEHWSSLATKMVETKTNIDESIQRWSGFLEHVKQVGKIIEKFEDALPELEVFQGTMSEKREQLEKLKNLDEKIRCEKLEMNSLKSKAHEMLKTGHQNSAVAETQEVFNKFDNISDKVKKLLNEREQQYKDHKTYKEAYEELSNFLNRSRDKIPSLKERPLSDKLAIENAITPLENLLNKRAQGELLLDNLNTIGGIIITSTSESGEAIIKQEISSIADELKKLFDDILYQKDNLHAIHTHWREYKDEYEKLSDWLQQIDISMKAIKNTPLATVLEKTDQVKQIQDVLDNLEKGKSNIDKFNESAGPLLNSHLETYVNNQLRHLNSRYEVQVNLAKDVQRKVETNLEHHLQYEKYLERAKAWINDAKEAIRCGNETTANTSKDVLQARLDKILELLKSQEEGQLIIHSTVNSGEKVLRSTRSDGKDLINNQLKEIQTDWDRLVKKIATSKVHIETSLLQWADYNSSYSHLEQWILDREAKLDEVCELKVTKAKKNQSGIGSLSIGERKATLRRTNSIVQDIVSFEPMIQKVTLKAEDLQQAVPANEITNKYQTLSIKAKDLYEKQKETVRLHQEFIDAGNDFAIWLRSAKERASKVSEPTGDKEMLSAKSVQFKVLQSELPDGQKKLEIALERAEKACSFADDEEKEIIEQEVVMLQEEFDIHNETLQKTKALLEDGIYKWNDFDDYSKGATEWLNNTEQLVQSYNKLQPSLEGKKEALEEFQTHLQTLFDWQKELDILNGKAQVLLETCSDTRLSNSITQMTTKYNTLLSLAKEIMRRLELHYQEHQQHNSLYQECLDWLERTRDKLNECEEIPNSLNEVKSKLQSLKVIRQTLEHGQNRLRYILELKEKVLLSTEPQGNIKIEEDTENLKQEFDKLSNKIQVCNNNLTLRVTQLEELEKFIKILNECLDDISSKINGNDLDQPLNDLSEKKTAFEKLKSLLRELNTHSDLVNRLSISIDDNYPSPQESITCISRYNSLTNLVTNKLSLMENQVAEHEAYRNALINVNDWLRKTRIAVQSCAETHGDCKINASKIVQLKDIEESFQNGEVKIKDVLALVETLKNSTGPEGCDKLNQDKNQLNSDWDELKHFIKEVQSALNKCAKSWEDFNVVYKALKDWETDLSNKVNAAASSNEPYTPDDLEQYKLWLQEIINQNLSIEELTDRCELLMELSTCNWVRDDTLKIQSSYTSLLTTTQGLVSKAEKSLTDHTEFIAAKEKVEEWLNRAHGTVQDCIGEGDLGWVKDKLQTVNLVSSRITEGQYLMNGMQEVFTKALNNTLAVERDALVNDMEELRNSWNSLNIDLNSVIAHLKSLQARWDENNEAKENLEKWLSSLESKVTDKNDLRADVGEMKTLLERLNHMINEIDEKETDFDHVIAETEELSKFCKNNHLNSDIQQLKTRKNILKQKTLKRKDSLENEITQHSNYLQALQESEKWLLQISFQLMAHNSLYITNREQTQEQIKHHQVLLNEIIQYQEVLDDLKSKGIAQIHRYVTSTQPIQSIVEKQLSNIQDSYNSLYNTAQQIKARLEESLLKFKQYENMLESIWSNLDDYQPLMNKSIDENWSLEETKDQLTIYKDLLNKLQGDKTRLALAVQACEAAVASISRPSSPVESTSQIPEQEISIRLRLEEYLDQVQNFVDELTDMVSILENKQNQRKRIYEWIENEMVTLNKIKEKPIRTNVETTAQEITNLNETIQNINDKKIEVSELVSGDSSNKLVNDMNILTDMTNEILLKKQSDQNLLLVFKNSEMDLQNWFDNLSKSIESLEKGSGKTCQQKLQLFNEVKENYINNGEKLINNLRINCQNLKEVVSVSDAQLLDDQIKSADRRYRDFWTRIERKYEILENSKNNLLYVKSKIEEIDSWINQKSKDLDENTLISYDSSEIEKKLNDLKNINKKAETSRIFLTDSLAVKLNAIELESEPIEFSELEENVYKPTVNKLKNLKTKINENLSKIKNMHEASQKFENTLNQCNSWLDSCEKDLSPDKYRLEPLELIIAEKNVEKILNIKRDIQSFKDGKLSDLEKNSQVLSSFCDKENVAVIKSVLNDILNKTKKVDEMSNFVEEKSKSVLEKRKIFENIVNTCQQWFNEVEVIMSADVRLSSLNVVEDQLQKYSELNKRSSEIDGIIDELKTISEQMLLCESDTLKISDQILSLENRQKRTKAMIKDRIEMLRQHLEKMKNISKTIEESKLMFSKVQSNLQELNRPVGSTVDEVKDVITSYETLLKELKEWNEKLADKDAESLNDVIKQQEELINTIEKQLSKLRQLLHLHEQFMTLIADIVTFLTTYSSVVNEIGKSGNTIQNKIKQFEEVTIKIQECEATLLLATDKGERIAEEGSAFDRNNITQQLQSLKQQLNTLRKAVEKERQKLEATAAEHIKLAADLEQVLDWIRENEAVIKSRPLLEINIDSLKTDLKAHEELKLNVDEHLSRLKAIHSTAQKENIEDSTVLESLSEASSFMNTIPKELRDRENYLNLNKDYRLEYDRLKADFASWMKEAKHNLESAEEDKNDDKNMVSNLDKFKSFFGDQTVYDLVTKKIKQSVDKIRPSLTSGQNDALTLEQQSFNRDLEDVMNSAKIVQKRLEEKYGLLNEYRNLVVKVSSILDRCKYNEEPVQNIAGLYYNAEKITLAQNDLLRQQNELDSLLDASKRVVDNVLPNDEIRSETDSIVKQWSELERTMSSRITSVTEIGEKWKNVEDEYRKIEIESNRIRDALTNVDRVVRSRNQLLESLAVLRKLKENLGFCGDKLNSTRPIGECVTAFLSSESHPAFAALRNDIKAHDDKHAALEVQLNDVLGQFEVNLNGFDEVEARLDEFQSLLNNLKPEVESFYVFDQDTERTQREFDDLSEKVKEAAGDLKKFIECTQNNYISSQKLVPNDLLSKFNPLELVSEELIGLMDSKSRGLKRARTVRTEYLKDVDDVQRWLQEAEVNVQDRGSEPKTIKEHIQTIENEIGAINDKLNRAIKHGKEIVEKTKDEEEKEMIPKTIESLVGKMSQVKLWLDEKRHQIGDTLDAWQKFLSVYDSVMAWCQSKTEYMEQPINLSSLEVAKQKAHEFSVAVKSSKQQSKNLAEMSKELDIVALSTDVGVLPEKLEEANNAKNVVEGKLSEKNALLHEACEEWEQFERKLKEVKSFIEKSQNAIESTVNKKRTLREQHDLREKMLADITIQRKKITLSTEKLQIHFRAGFGGTENIEFLAKENLSQLDNLFKIVEEQAHNLEESLSQLDKYQQEIQHLRQKVITAEQQLRLIQSPTYLPHDRQKAVQEQNALQEQIRVLQSKINSRTERIKLIIQRGSPISDPLLNY